MISTPIRIVLFIAIFTFAAGATAADVPNPTPRPIVLGETVKRWDFDSDGGWHAQHACRLSAADGVLKITSTGADPYLAASLDAPRGGLALRARMKSSGSGIGQFFWSSSATGGCSPEDRNDFRMTHDGQWHDYQVMIHAEQPLKQLRLDPGGDAGEIEVDWIEVRSGGLHPVEITALQAENERLVVSIHNHDEEPIRADVNGAPIVLPPSQTTPFSVPLKTAGPLERLEVTVAAEGLPEVRRALWIYRPEAAIDGARLSRGDLSIDVAQNGSVLRVKRDGQIIAALAPVVHRDGVLPQLEMEADGGPIRLAGDGVTVTLNLTSEGELQIRIQSQRPVEGPVVRAFGRLEQGLLAGVEYLGKGESSSSKLDIETAEHLRVEPEPMKITMPLMACVTDRATVALAWNDMSLQPVFAVPNFLDGTPDHRMALKGTSVDALLRFGPGWRDGGRLERVILWDVERRGLPALPQPPRPRKEQAELSLAAYSGLVHDPDNGGWFHAVVPNVRRMPLRGNYFADHVSSIWRITGNVPEVPSLAHGGSHVRNSAGYFVTGRADQWLRVVNGRAEALIARQAPDGSFHYAGKYRRGHFEDTASGICARPALDLLDHAYHTGNERSLAAGLKALEYMKRFRTPRGSQTWEVPLHTPDILASAQLVWAYVRGYELTKDTQWLDEARRWAITGLPFVYQWSNQPIMVYATTPVLGATNWRAPNWIGLPVQWCGIVYAYGLLLLADYDETLDWRKVAEGILVCGEQMQYPDGPSEGCLPDVFRLSSQGRLPADINPSALVSLRLLIDGRLDALDRARDEHHIVVAPFPVTLRGGQAHVQARAGVKYQVLVDGKRIVDINSQGKDVVDLE